MRPDEWRQPAVENDDFVAPPAAEVAAASPPGEPGYIRRNRTELVVLAVGLFLLAWMILMQDVRVGLPGQVTVAPVEVRPGGPDLGGSSSGTRPPIRSISPESSRSPTTRTSPGSISP